MIAPPRATVMFNAPNFCSGAEDLYKPSISACSSNARYATYPPTTVLMKLRIGMKAVDFRFSARASRREVAAAEGEVSSSYSSSQSIVSYWPPW